MSEVSIISASVIILVFCLKYMVFIPSMFKLKHVGRVNMLDLLSVGWEALLGTCVDKGEGFGSFGDVG